MTTEATEMKMYDYGFDVNRIIAKANEQGNYPLESYALQLDEMLSTNHQISSELERFLDHTIEFLYGVVDC
jgi:hypothetical protein